MPNKIKSFEGIWADPEDPDFSGANIEASHEDEEELCKPLIHEEGE